MTTKTLYWPWNHIEWKGYFYSLLLFIVLSGNSIIYHVAFHHMMTLGLKVKTALIGLIYKKVNPNGILDIMRNAIYV